MDLELRPHQRPVQLAGPVDGFAQPCDQLGPGHERSIPDNDGRIGSCLRQTPNLRPAATFAAASPRPGRRIENALVLAIALPTFAFLAARSLIGFLRWRLQRELWRRDVERLNGAEEPAA